MTNNWSVEKKTKTKTKKKKQTTCYLTSACVTFVYFEIHLEMEIDKWIWITKAKKQTNLEIWTRVIHSWLATLVSFCLLKERRKKKKEVERKKKLNSRFHYSWFLWLNLQMKYPQDKTMGIPSIETFSQYFHQCQLITVNNITASHTAADTMKGHCRSLCDKKSTKLVAAPSRTWKTDNTAFPVSWKVL